MKSRTTRQFRELRSALPKKVQRQARRAFMLFCGDPDHPSLHFKQVHEKLPVYSARITRSYRAVGILKNDKMVWFWIGSHTDYDKLPNLM